jgi:oxygen-independent coproporphyrinogen-3 oxidase
MRLFILEEPSVLTSEEIDFWLQQLVSISVIENPEITLEVTWWFVNRTDYWTFESKVNRLSIGIQSFFEDDLNDEPRT